MLSNRAVPNEYGKFRRRVLNGEEPVNRWVALQMNRIDYLIDSPEFYYNDEAIDGFINFCESEMSLTNGDRVTMLPSFKLWAEDLLAWFYYQDEQFFNQRTQRFEVRKTLRRLRNRQYLIVARGAAKSMYMSFIQAYFLFIHPKTTKQVATAPTMRQAMETLSPIQTALTVKNGPVFQFFTQGNKFANGFLDKKMFDSTKAGIVNRISDSLLEVQPMRVDKLQGSRAVIATVDEWLSGDTKEDPFDALIQSAGKDFAQYLILGVSSEGTVRDGIGDSIKMELIDILEGNLIDDHCSIWYYRLDSLNEVGMPEMWRKANPNLGATVSYEEYERDVRRAESQPSKRSDILAKRFGIPVEGYTYFFTYEETVRHNKCSFDGMECSMGADLSQGDDFCAFTCVFPLGGQRYGVKSRAYVSSVKVSKLSPAMRIKYEELEKEGSLVVMDGGILKMGLVYDELDEWLEEHNYEVTTLGYDPYNSDEFLKRWVSDNGEFGIEKVNQGVKTESVPLGELKNLAGERNLIFDQELMKFTMGNSIAIEDNNGNRKLSKRRSAEKIDCVAAMMDAWVAYQRNLSAFE